MNKFQKRLAKLSRHNANALVVGSAFGNLSLIIDTYLTVFVVADAAPTVKAKNLVYKQNFDRLESLTDVGAVFFDLDTVHQLAQVQAFWRLHNATVFVEGHDAIGREHSRPLYDSGWRCTSLQGAFHVWEQQQ